MATMTESYMPGASTFDANTDAIQGDRWQKPQWSMGSSSYGYTQAPTQPRIDLEHILPLHDSNGLVDVHGPAREGSEVSHIISLTKNNQTGLEEGLHNIGRGDRSVSRVHAASVGNNTQDLESKWIHRDKLAQIESQELAEIGIQLGLTDRIIGQSSRSSVEPPTTPKSPPYHFSSGEDQSQFDIQLPGAKRLRTTSGSLLIDNEGGRTHAMQAQTDGTSLTTPSPVRLKKPGYSKIPIPKSSPASRTTTPMHHDQAVYLARRGSIKNARNSVELLGNQNSRKSNASTVEADLIERPTEPGSPELQVTTPPSSRPTSISNPKRRSASDGKRLSRGGRAVSGQERPRTASAPLKSTNSPMRPSTSGGPRQPINRPEGEAPWIATMFKPDPMLPQDEQIIPTHAKRLAMQHGHVIPTVEPSEYISPPAVTTSFSRPLDANRTPEVIQQPSCEPHMVKPQFQESHIVEQQDHDPYVQESQTEEWPLRTASIVDQDKQYMLHPEMEEHATFESDPSQGQRKNNELTNQNLTKQEQSARPQTIVHPPPTTANPTPKVTRVPGNPMNEKQDKACGCCVLM